MQRITNYLRSCIESDFNGWDGGTIFELCNGQVWQQQSFRIKVSFKIRPSVLIYEDVFGAFRMKVEGIADTISVVRLE